VKINNKPLALLHAPKTGGSSIVQDNRITEFGHMQVYDDNINSPRVNYTYLYHDRKTALQAILPLSHVRKYYTLFIVRNHFSWLVSYADWCSCFSNWNFDHHDAIYARKGFDYLIKTIINRENAWPSRNNIFCQMFTTSGSLVPDYILHTENLDNELKFLFSKYNEEWIPPPRVQIGRRHGNFGARSAGRGKNLHISSKQTKKPIHEMYSDKLAEEVWLCWNKEMKMLGYGPNPNKLEAEKSDDVLFGDVTECKKTYTYYWNETK